MGEAASVALSSDLDGGCGLEPSVAKASAPNPNSTKPRVRDKVFRIAITTAPPPTARPG